MAETGETDLDCGDLTVVVRFVIPKGRTEVTVTEALAQAFDPSKEAGLAPVWVQEQEVLNISPTKTVTFIHGDLVSHPCHVTGESPHDTDSVSPDCQNNHYWSLIVFFPRTFL